VAGVVDLVSVPVQRPTPGAEGVEDVQADRHIADIWQVLDDADIGGQDGGGQDAHRRILCAGYIDFAHQGLAACNNKLLQSNALLYGVRKKRVRPTLQVGWGPPEIPLCQAGFCSGADAPPPAAATLLYTTCKKKQSFRPGLCSYFLFCPDSPNTFADFLSFTQNVHDSTGRRGPLPDPVLALCLLDPAQLIGDDQLFQVVDLLPQRLALVHILHQDAAVLLFQHALPRDDVDVLGDGLFGADEGLVGPQGHIPAGIGQGVAGDAGLFVVGAAEPAVNDDQPAAALDGALAVFLLHRHVPVDDVARPRQPELGQD